MNESTGRLIRVGLNAHLLSMAASYRSAGISWYIRNLLRHLPEADPDIHFTAFVGERRYQGQPGLEMRPSPLSTHRPLLRIAWEQAVQPSAASREKLDLLHGLALVGPLLSACPQVITIHDLSFLHYPQNLTGWRRLYLQAFTRWSARRARRVIAISENTRADVVKHYGLVPERVDTVHYGLDPIFQPLPVEQVASFRLRQGLPERFILFVGTLEPRKNVVRLIEAYARLPQERPPLVLIGGKGWFFDEIYRRVEELEVGPEVRFAGFVAGEELPWWYNAAELFVYPSLYEGFGLPPLEAMACGTPVITSAGSSLPEVVGQAGLLVDPLDVEALAAAMQRVLDNRELKQAMSEAGLKQARTFSWPEAARRTAASYRKALAGGNGNGHV